MRRYPPSLSTMALLAAPLLAGALAQTSPVPATPALKAGPADLKRGETLASSCAGCHGPTGRAPVLKGESATHLQAALVAYRSGTWPNPVMKGVAAHLSDQDIVDVSAFYAGPTAAPATAPVASPATPVPPAPATPGDPAALGRALYLEGDPARDVLACAVCHGEDGQGAENLGIPALTGRSAQSVLSALKAYKSMPVVGIPYPDAMRIALKPLSDADLSAVSAFVATLK
ncbi:c-type cytochrome [Deinococcus taeanensis]|uniref:c-type cytochrome n=1 Tax=Deinococcus taeanensis TaxID=2737050 RepID=UPI001CDBB872|nr:c-type cytochrome [Deinococcus taeanensis]UBV43406.1 c-type cytochrome [Deinococcus taeanensis]